MAKVIYMDHPLVKHKIGIIRRKETGTKEFRETISEIAMLECYEATRDLEMDEEDIETPIGPTKAHVLKGKKLAVVPILRAGLGMVEGMLTLIPAAKVGHIGLYRDPETLEPVEYYCKLPSGHHAQTARLQEPAFPVHHCRSGRCEGLYRGAPGCRSLCRRAG